MGFPEEIKRIKQRCFLTQQDFVKEVMNTMNEDEQRSVDILWKSNMIFFQNKRLENII